MLRAATENHRFPITNSTPKTPLDKEKVELTDKPFVDFATEVIESHSRDAQVKLGSLAGIPFAGATTERHSLAGKIVTLKRLA